MTEIVLVLCHGNICRSPLAGELMRRAGVKNVVTAGFKEKAGTKSPKKMRDWALANQGIDLSEHRAQPVTVELLRKAQIILYMDGGQESRLVALWEANGLDKEIGPIYGRARPLGAFLTPQQARIGDPMFAGNMDSPAFLAIMDQLVRASNAFAEQWKAGQVQSLGAAKQEDAA